MYTWKDGKADGGYNCSVYLMASRRFWLYLKAKVGEKALCINEEANMEKKSS